MEKVNAYTSLMIRLKAIKKTRFIKKTHFMFMKESKKMLKKLIPKKTSLKNIKCSLKVFIQYTKFRKKDLEIPYALIISLQRQIVS